MDRRARLLQLMRRRRLLLALLFLLGLGGILMASEHPSIWPVRNTLLYKADRWWRSHISDSRASGGGLIYGCVRNPQGQPVPGATVLVAEDDGTLHRVRSDPAGCYRLAGVPAGRYVLLATADGFGLAQMRPWGLPFSLDAGEEQLRNVSLPLLSLPSIAAAGDLRIGEPLTVTRDLPQPGAAVRREVHYLSDGSANQQTLLYTPVRGRGPFPTLLAVYPGPAGSWEGVSVPLAAAGYAVIAIGPEYALDLERDIAELQRLTALARAGLLPGADGRHITLLGGSYSSLHLYRLLQRDSAFRSVVLLGGAGDLFDLRRRFEHGTFFPPFGLDQALIALGWPSTSPERYWRYSGLYHLQSNLPPVLLMHSRQDEVVPYQQSEQVAAELTRLGVSHEAHFFDGMSHYLRTDTPSPDLDRLYAITIAFLRRTLSPPALR